MEGIFKDEREDVQKKTFAKWVNSQLSKRGESPVTDLFYDLRDGTKLLLLLEILTDTKHVREKGGMRVHRLSNVRRALDVLASHNVKLVNISADHIVDGSPKITLGLVWAIILHWQVQGVLKEVMAGLQQTSLEKTLLAWCRQSTKGYTGVDIRNFSSSWSDGLAFNALIHRHRPDLFEWVSLANKVPFARLQHAFNLASEHLGIDQLLDPEDVHTQAPDKKSVMMYVMCLFQALPPDRASLHGLEDHGSPDSSLTESPSEGAASNLPSPSSPSVAMRSPSQTKDSERPASMVTTCLVEYFKCLEEVLMWLLGAEERLSAMPEIGDTTAVLKEQFHALEAVMLELTARQSGVGDVLKDGGRLVHEGVAKGSEAEEIRRQMVLLNTRWEDLRVKAMNRQSMLHMKLMQLQQSELEALKNWLSSTEDRISAMGDVGSSLEEVQQQLEQHRVLQRDLEHEQANISSLSNMVVVVDDPATDAAYMQLEDELTALGERWSHVCKWSEQQWAILQALALHWRQLEEGVLQLTAWLDDKEKLLRQMESNPSMEQQHILSQASILQELQCELELRHEQLSGLQEQSSAVLSVVPPRSPAHADIPRTLETIQDRWDCLHSIIEAQKSRLEKCGIDVSTVVVMGGKVRDDYGVGDLSGSHTSTSSTTTTTTKTAHGSTIITRVITTKSVSSQESLDPGGQSKRQKLDVVGGRVDSPGGGSSVCSSSPVPVDPSTASDVTQGGGETYKSEAVLMARDSCEPADVAGVMLRLEDIETKLLPSATLNKSDEQREELQRAIVRELSALESAYRRARGEAGSRSREQQQLVAQWLAIQNMLRRIRSESVPSSEAQIADRFSLLHTQYSETLEWLNDAAVALQQPGDDEDVRSEMVNLRSSIEDGLESLQLLSRVAQERLPADTGSSLRSDIAALLHSWLSLDTRLKELENSMYVSSSAPIDTDSPIEEVRTVEVIDMERSSSRKMVEKIETVVQEVLEVQVEGLESLERWLTQVEREVTAAPLLDVLPSMMAQMNTFRGYLNRVIAEADRLAGHQREMAEKMSATAASSTMDSESSSVVTDVTNNMAEVMSTVSSAAEKCGEVRLLLERRLAALAEGVDALEQHQAEVKGLQSWLAEVKVFLRAEEDQVLGRADLETLKAQLLQSNALEGDIVTLSSNLASVEQTCAKLESGSAPAPISEIGEVSAALREEARETAHRLRSEWDNIVSTTRQLNDKLIEAVKTKEADSVKGQWLEWAEKVKVPSGSGIETTSDLQAAIKACEILLDELRSKKSFIDSSELEEASRADVEKQHRELHKQVQDRLEFLQGTLRDYNLFKELSAAENSWLLELEQKLLLWEQPAADAEEISAKQDELESFLRRHNEEEGRTRLDEVAESLVQRQTMTVAVQNCQHDIQTRRKALTDKSESVQQSMEKASARAQESEQKYLTLLERVSSLHQLSCVVHSDQGFQEKTLKIQNEIAANKKCMEELRSQMEVLRTEGNQPAADRLSQQLQLLQSKLEEVETQLREDCLQHETQTQAALSVSSPVAPRAASAAAGSQSSGVSDSATEKRASIEVTDRIAELREQLLATGDRAKQLTLEAAAPTHVHDKLCRCLVVYRELSEVKSSVEGTLATGRRLVKERISTQPHTLSSKLDDLKALYNELGSDVTQRRTELEEGVHQSRKLEREMTASDKLLTASELTLAEAAKAVDADKTQQHIQAVKVALEELRVKRPLLTGAWESYNYLAGLAAGEGLREAQAALEELERRWESCVARLADAKQRHEAGEEQKEGEMSEFILRLADIKAWLEGTEQKLAQELPANERTALLKVLSEEVVEYRSAVESIKSAGASHVSHGTFFRDKLEPELRDITRRWESINTQVKKQEKQQQEDQRSSSDAGAQKLPRSSPGPVRSAAPAALSSTTVMTSATTAPTSVKASSFRSTAHVQLSPTSGEADDVNQYLQKVTALVDKIAAVRMKAQVVPVVSQAMNNAQALEQEVKALETDVASVISRGDSLVLAKDGGQSSDVEAAVKELRTTWAQLRAQTEVVKSESELVATELSSSSERVNAIVSWLNDFNKRVNLLDTDYSQLQALEQELASKRSAVDDLNSTAALLTKYRHQQLLPSLAVVNTRWAEVTALLKHYRRQGGPDPSRHQRAQNISPSLVPDYIASVNKVRETVSSIARQVVEPRHPFHNLGVQQDEIRKLQDRLTDTKELVERVEEERSVAIKGAAGNSQQTDQVRRVTDKLREEWAQVNRSVNEQHASLAERQATWHSLQTSLSGLAQWLAEAEDRLRVSTDEPLAQAKLTQKELEKQVTLKHRVSQKVQEQSTEVLDGLPAAERAQLQQRVDGVLARWRGILSELAARRTRIASEGGGGSQYESISTWLAQANALLQTPVNVTDESALAAHTTMVQNHVSELNTKKQLLKTLQDVQPAIVSQSQVAELQASVDKLSQALPEYQNTLETKLSVIRNLLDGSEDLYRWTEKIRLQAQAPQAAGGGETGTPRLQEDPVAVVREMQRELEEKSSVYETLDSTYWVLAHDADSKGLPIDSSLKKRMSIIDARLKVMPEQLAAAREVLAKQADAESSEESARVLQQTITLDASAASGASEASGVAPPSPLMRSSKPPTGASPSYIIASLDKSILQIRDWLTVVEQMCRQQTVVVGDLADIRTMTEKQRNVLRELEGKKPQLDDLVASADSLRDDSAKLGTKPQQSATTDEAAIYKYPSQARLFDHLRTCFKVAKLREHWDETNSAVLARKTQLDAMLADSHKLETKRSEVEAWLARMEHRLERSQALGHTPDMIDQQIREQKGQQAELQQYKHQMELLNQQTQRLLTIYQQDDTRLLRRRGEALNARFNNLQSNIAMRGKALHSAVNSNSNFDKALEKFFCWLNEAEASTASVDLDSAPDKVASAAGPLSQRRDLGRHVTHIKDLQSEIESHKDVVASLNATGQKLLGTLENQDEAMMLHRRLEEMNTRWNTLKHRSIAIRSRLEGNTESWNSLLLSLRELIEWVIRKDTELTAMGPPSGDIATLTKLESDLVSFRRVLDEKQPVVESNLKSGRQLIASEPPLSDTSDSEAGRDLDGDARRHGEESARELTRSVRREVAKLSEKWAALRERAAAMATNISLANKKLGVLQKTLEEVDGRLDVAEGTVSNWGPVPQDSNLAEQHVHNVTKFREGLSDLQRGVDDVNDQAARFSAHNIPLAADTSTRLHRLNARWKQVEGIVNDRWRQVAGRSRDVTPLTPAQLGSSVSHPWERAVANNKVPYYINHAQETTYWDHPEMMSLLDELADLNHIKFSAYRTAAKLRALQKKLALDQATLQLVTDVFDEHGLRGQNDRLIEVSDMVVVLSTLYCRIASDRPDVNTSLTTDLCLNWLLNVYDSQRTGQMRVLSFRVGLVCLCKGHLEEKYRYVFRLIADPNRLVDQRKLGLLLHDCVQVPRQLGEVAAFGGSNIEPSVRSCFTKAGKDRETIEAVHFLSWVQQEPQSLVWLAVLHRVAASEHIQHQVKCNICKTCPIVGLRYRCLKCIGFDMCQKCFFEGRSSKSHKITHPMHEYCTATTAGDEMKDFTKALKNKFKSKRSLQKHTKKGYLPVQTVLEGDPLESPSPSPQHGVSSQDMHNRLEQYASRLAEVELRTNSNSTPDSEDEHGLIAQYCQSLSSGDGAALPVPRSPLQVMAAVDADQKDELEQMIRELEEENQALQAEYEQLRLQQEPSDSPQSSGGSPLRSEAEMLAEARLLRQHKGRLEARMTILEQHNQQLEAQLHRLRQLLQQNGGSSMNKSGTLQTKSVTASQLATDSPAKVNGHSGQGAGGPSTSSYEGLDQVSEYVRPPPPPMGNVAHVGNLFSRAGDLERAVGSLVATVTHDQERDSRNGSRQASEGREDEPFPVPQLDHEIEQYDNNPMPAEKDR